MVLDARGSARMYKNHIVMVTFDNPRGWSGFSPRSTASDAAISCAGMI